VPRALPYPISLHLDKRAIDLFLEEYVVPYVGHEEMEDPFTGVIADAHAHGRHWYIGIGFS
jgi:hypothetical protein